MRPSLKELQLFSILLFLLLIFPSTLCRFAALALNIPSPSTFASSLATRQDAIGSSCLCNTQQAGLYCGFRAQDETEQDIKFLWGECEGENVYRCFGEDGMVLAKLQVVCGMCVRGDETGVDRCFE